MKQTIQPNLGTSNLFDFDLTVFICRAQPFTEAHLFNVTEALKRSKTVLILLGSAGSPRCHRNPFTYEERSDMVRLSVDPEFRDRIVTMPLEDSTYNDDNWIKDVQKAVQIVCEHRNFVKPRIALIGHKKDVGTSYYLKMFPQWDSINLPNFHNISATNVRAAYFSNIVEMWLGDCDGHIQGDLPQDHLVPPPVREFLKYFTTTADWKSIKDEYEFISSYRQQWINSPYPPIFVTVDAIVIQSGHVLLIKRRDRPGKGLWALPGGFIRQDELIVDAMIRELREETKIAVPEAVLRGSIKVQRVFDDPNRSARGRTITHAFLLHLRPDVVLPNIRKKNRANLATVEQGDDAQKAEWVPLVNVNRGELFEDHYHIISSLTSVG